MDSPLPRFIPEGSFMPSLEGHAVTWAATENPEQTPGAKQKERDA
jgi:hypothetical protein